MFTEALPPVFRQWRARLAGLLLGLTAAAAQAQGWPVAGKPITIVSAYPAGGFSDVIARVLGERLTEKLKVTVVVENRPGGGGQIAASHVKQQPADGHTLWLGDVGPFATSRHLYNKLSYDMQNDFVGVARLTLTPVLLVVPADSPLRSFDALVQESRSGEQGLLYGSQGTGLGSHLFTELMQRQVGGRLVHVPYKGSVPALQDLATGRIQFMWDNAVTSAPFVRDGRLRALAVRATKRMAEFPDVPTLAELGHPQLNNSMLWGGLVARAGTPPAVVQRVADEFLAALRHPATLKRFADLHLEAAPLGPADFQRFLVAEDEKWGRAVRETQIRIE
ncbi:tripartite tricarboxylate transporter substrate binding protein [Aquabacterium sp. J223]|uniref:Bug family tripartite tricarboxylate transporter substrate binding protein n=1 Tax=Aquabacterium sp. J223 TaxID=2898431 RepID=UPI0021AE0157|nr:tripartite tricarboxylate transporter substrate binding protein [Aquabacterium sp. J223]UUX94773.1 tripartite tricarboxylate transporter substrate binding protein [Aquabacterium sp. J223]